MAINVNMAKVNPFCPIFLLKIGDVDFTLQNSPEMGEYVIEFSMNRSAEDFANDIVIRLFDKTALMIEWYIFQGYKSVEFQFGMDETNLSKLFKANIKDYQLQFLGSRTTVLELSLQLGAITDSVDSEQAKTYETSKPSEAFKMIATEMEWKLGKVADTKAIENTTSFNRQSETAEDFIKNTLIPKAVTPDGKTDFTFYKEFDDEGNTVVNFLPKDTVEEGAEVKNYQIVIGGGQRDDSITDPEVVISFTPSYGGILQALTSVANGGTTTPTDEQTQDGTQPGTEDGVDEQTPQDSVAMANLNLGTGSNSVLKNPLTATPIGLIKDQLNQNKDQNMKKPPSVVVKTPTIDSLSNTLTEAAVLVTGKDVDEAWDAKINGTGSSSSSSSTEDTSVTSTSGTTSTASSLMQDVNIEVPTLADLKNAVVSPYTNSSIERVIGGSAYTEEEAGRIAEYMWTKMSTLDNSAELVLRGDSSFTVQSFVTIVVLTPDGFFHHSSGVYQVLEIVDDISGGSYTTTLNMVKRTLIVNEDGTIEPGQATGYMYKSSQVGGGQPSSGTIGTSLDEQNLRKICDTYNGKAYSQAARLGPNSYDCSSMVNTIMGDLGIEVNWATTADGISKKDTWGTIVWEKGRDGELTVDMIKPGYVGCYNQGGAGHTWIFINQTTIFHAAGRKKGVLYADITEYYVKQLNKKSNGRAVVWAPPPSTGSPVKNIAKSCNFPELN